MKFDTATRKTRRLRKTLHDIFRPGLATTATCTGQLTRQGLAIVLSVLMIMIPLTQGDVFAQSVPPVTGDGAQLPQPLSAEQLDQLVAPIALYPDALVAQVLAAATYPTQVVEAGRWLQAQGNAPAGEIAAGAENQSWDPSVKALTAFPTVLAQMDRNLQWTTDLGNAYYNQPQDVMDAIQVMRQKAEAAGQLRSMPQQVVTNTGGVIAIAPANPTVVYVPAYNPWTVYGVPFPVYPGYYYAPTPGAFWGGLAIGFGVGISVGLLAHWGWGWSHWGIGWHQHAVFYNHNNYITRSTTVINRGFNRPGGPPRNFAARGAYARPVEGFNRPGGSFNRPGAGYRGTVGANRPGSNYGHSGGVSTRSSVNSNRPAGNYGRSSAGPRASVPRPPMNRRSVARGGGYPGGSNHVSGGHYPSSGIHARSGGHPSRGSHVRGGGHRG